MYSPSDGHGPTPPLIEIKGIIFDMDGTLTIPVLNFSEMKTRLGLSPNQDILPTVQSYPPEERAKAMSIIEEFEEEGVHRMKVHIMNPKNIKQHVPMLVLTQQLL